LAIFGEKHQQLKFDIDASKEFINNLNVDAQDKGEYITPSRLIVNDKNVLVRDIIFYQHFFRIATLPRDKVFEVPVSYWWGNNFCNVVSSLLRHDVIANKEMWLGQRVVDDISLPSL